MAPPACWFCGRAPSGPQAMAFPFFSQVDDETRFVVVPRCEECFAFHTRQQMPSNYVVLGSVVTVLAVASVLPIPPAARVPVNVVALIGGVAGGIVLTARRERWAAARRGTRPKHDYNEHETYRTFFTDQARWRAHRDPTAHKDASTVFRLETVADYRLKYADEPRTIAALDRACADG
jgi:hypothetical protein